VSTCQTDQHRKILPLGVLSRNHHRPRRANSWRNPQAWRSSRTASQARIALLKGKAIVLQGRQAGEHVGRVYGV